MPVSNDSALKLGYTTCERGPKDILKGVAT